MRSLGSAVGLVGLVVLGSCGSAPPALTPAAAGPPGWVRDRTSPQHPPARYLVAVGAATIGTSVEAAQEQAELAARGQMVRTFSSQVESDTRLRTVFEALDGASHEEVSMHDTVRVVSSGTLEGARPAEFHVDEAGRTAYCLLVLDRAEGAAVIAQKVRARQADAAALAARAAAAGAAGEQLDLLLEALDTARRARVLRVSHDILAGRPLAGGDAGDEILARLRSLVAALRLSVTGGGQEVRPGEGLAAPIDVRVQVEGGAPVSGIVVRLEPEFPDRVELSAARITTGADGVARFEVRRAAGTGRRANRILCSLEALRSRDMAGPAVAAEYLLPTPAQCRVVVLARVDGGTGDGSDVAAAVTEELSGAGFPVVPASRARLDGPAGWAAAASDLVAAAADHADRAIRIVARVAAQPAAGERQEARVAADVELIDLDRATVDALPAITVRGVGATHHGAAVDGLAKLGRRSGRDIVARLRAALGLPPQ